ncbi:MAG: TetR-like C-terminal domain-containing protein [Bacteroidota bacterium]
MRSSSYHHGDLRRALLGAAAEALATEGAAALTLRGLAARVGVSRSAPYRHFETKEALLAAVAAEGFERLATAVQTARQNVATSDETFVALAKAYVAFARAHPSHYRLMYGREALSRQDHPALQDAADGLYDALTAAITEAQAAGLVRSGEVAPLVGIAWALVHGLAMLLVEGQMEPPASDDTLAELAARTLLRGLSPAD